ncbi:MAG: hypothetical protein Q7T53_08805 [Deltaproteobacteria bacterium]|nr:hypothetical protein [Deltaproteobacteria bacterium]
MTAGIVFAISFNIVDAVIWPSAYADPIAFLFSITALIGFYKYLKTPKSAYYVITIIFFILALSAKIQAMFLPIGLFVTELYYLTTVQQKFKTAVLIKYLPFIILNLVYLLLLKIFAPPLDAGSIINLSTILSNIIIIPLLYIIPEGILPHSILYPLIIDIGLFVILLVLFFRHSAKNNLIWYGPALLFMGILALVPLKWNFPLYPDPMNESIRHRLYLGNLGFSILAGVIIHEIYLLTSNRLTRRALFVCGLFVFLALNLSQLYRIKSAYIKVTSDTEKSLNQLRELITQLPIEKRNIYIVNFPPNQGFGVSIQKLFLNIKGLNLGLWPTEIPIGLPEDSLQIYLHLNGNIYDRNSNVRNVASTAWEHLYSGQFLLLTGKQADAVEELRMASTNSSWGDGKIHHILGVTYLGLGEKEQAIEELNKAILNNRRYPEIYSLLGTLYFEKGDINRAIENLGLALKSNPADFKIMEDLALIYEAKGEIQKARILFKKALSFESRPEYRRQIEEKLHKH